MNWAYALRSAERRVISPPSKKARLKASVLDRAMIVLSRSKKAAGRAPAGAVLPIPRP